MPGRHRKTTAPQRFVPLAVCGFAVAAAAVLVLWVALRPGPAAQPVSAAEAPPQAAVGMGQAPTNTSATPRPAPRPAAAAQPPPPSAKPAQQHRPPAVPCPTELAGTQPHVAQVGHLVDKTFAVGDIGGAAGRWDGDHGAGLALDFMTSDPPHGDAIADFVLANQDRFGVNYVIWQQQYNDGSGWSAMEDRGSPTENHYDHVHVSFAADATGDVTC